MGILAYDPIGIIDDVFKDTSISVVLHCLYDYPMYILRNEGI